MAQGMELWRPDWFKIMRGSVFDHMDANELVQITRETARLAMSALREQNARYFYHSYGAAERELIDTLAAK